MKNNRKPLIAGNWKMNTNVNEGLNLIDDIQKQTSSINTSSSSPIIDVVFCPPFITLKKVHEILDSNLFSIGAQNMHWEEKGAYTGEISPLMLKNLVDYVIIGHSERRQLFGETDEIVRKKLEAALQHDIKPILCVGESQEIRSRSEEQQFISSQLDAALANLKNSNGTQLIIAYEPIWAIGTGNAASAEQAQEICVFIRNHLAQILSPVTADTTRILYGGSTTAANIKEFLAQPDIDGALVGGASLKALEFTSILWQTHEMAKKL
ncbi:MAG: triose-phosphate isomerase [bacterium]